VLVTKISLHVHFLTFAKIESIFRLMFTVKDKKRMHNFVVLIRAKQKEFESLKKGAHERKRVQSKKKMCA
jgi:hypothetical protein